MDQTLKIIKVSHAKWELVLPIPQRVVAINNNNGYLGDKKNNFYH